MQETESQTTRRARTIAGCSGILTLLFGGVGFVSGLAGWLTLTSYFKNAIPMALSTASLFCCIGIILSFYFGNQYRSRLRFTRVSLALIVFLAGCINTLEFPLHLPRDFDPLDRLFFQIQSSLEIPPVGMSPLTGFLFSLAGVAHFLLELRPQNRREVGRDISGLAGVALAVISLTLFLGYIYGTPLLYGSQYIPVSASTALAFVFAGIGIACASGTANLPLRPFLGVSIQSKLLRVFTPPVFIIVLLYPIVNQATASYLRINNAILGSAMAMAFAWLATVAVYRIGARIGQQIDQAEALRQSAEAELKESENRYRRLFEQANV